MSSSQDGKQMLFQLSKKKKKQKQTKSKGESQVESSKESIPCARNTRTVPQQHTFHPREAERCHWIPLIAERHRG